MKKLKKHKRTTSVPLLCWDIYAEHLNIQLGRADAASKEAWDSDKKEKSR
jgi:hypothetical protein